MGARASRPPPFSSIICDRNRATAQFQADSRLVPLGREKGNGVRGLTTFADSAGRKRVRSFWCWRGELNPSGPLRTCNLLILRSRKNAHRRIPGGKPRSGQARILQGTKLRSTNSASSQLDGGRAGRGVKGRDNAPLSRGALDPAPGTRGRWCRQKLLDNADAVIDALPPCRPRGHPNVRRCKDASRPLLQTCRLALAFGDLLHPCG